MSNEVSEKIISIIKSQGRTHRWVYKKLGMTSPTFSNRLRKGDWKLTEIEVLSKLLGEKIL